MKKEITPEIFIAGGDNTHPHDAAVYLISSAGESALVDAGTGKCNDRIINNIKSTGISPDTIRYIFLTHCHYDHTGGAAGLKKITGAEIVAHELDAVYLEEGNSEVTAASWYGETQPVLSVDRKISSDKELFMLGSMEITALHTPGHTPGSIVLLVKSEGKTVLFGQDVHGPLHPALKSDRGDYINSLKLLLTLEADILCEGHYGVISGKDRVRDFIRSFIS